MELVEFIPNGNYLGTAVTNCNQYIVQLVQILVPKKMKIARRLPPYGISDQLVHGRM
jgi:hypothetical protein